MNKCTGSNCFSFSRMLHVSSTIGHILRYALGVSREFFNLGDQAGIPLPLASQCTQYNGTSIPIIVIPKALRLKIKKHVKGTRKIL